MTVRHTFGGSGMDRYLFDFEAVLDETSVAVTGEEAAETPEPPAETAPVTPSWEGSPEMVDRVAELVAQQLAQREPADATVEPADLDLDPFSDTFGQNIAKLLRDEIATAMAPVQSRFAQEAEQEADARITSMIDDEAERAGGFPADIDADAKDLVKKLAPAFTGEAIQRWGQTDKAAEVSLAKATSAVLGLIAKATKAGATGEQASLTALATATRELPGAGAAITQLHPGGDELEVARRYGGI